MSNGERKNPQAEAIARAVAEAAAKKGLGKKAEPPAPPVEVAKEPPVAPQLVTEDAQRTLEAVVIKGYDEGEEPDKPAGHVAKVPKKDTPSPPAETPEQKRVRVRELMVQSEKTEPCLNFRHLEDVVPWISEADVEKFCSEENFQFIHSAIQHELGNDERGLHHISLDYTGESQGGPTGFGDSSYQILLRVSKDDSWKDALIVQLRKAKTYFDEEARNAAEAPSPATPKEAPSVAEMEPPHGFKLGQAIWHNETYDYPVEVVGYAGRDQNGRHWVYVKSSGGGKAGQPFDEIVYGKEEESPARSRSKRQKTGFSVTHEIGKLPSVEKSGRGYFGGAAVTSGAPEEFIDREAPTPVVPPPPPPEKPAGPSPVAEKAAPAPTGFEFPGERRSGEPMETSPPFVETQEQKEVRVKDLMRWMERQENKLFFAGLGDVALWIKNVDIEKFCNKENAQFINGAIQNELGDVESHLVAIELNRIRRSEVRSDAEHSRYIVYLKVSKDDSWKNELIMQLREVKRRVDEVKAAARVAPAPPPAPYEAWSFPDQPETPEYHPPAGKDLRTFIAELEAKRDRLIGHLKKTAGTIGTLTYLRKKAGKLNDFINWVTSKVGLIDVDKQVFYANRRNPTIATPQFDDAFTRALLATPQFDDAFTRALQEEYTLVKEFEKFVGELEATRNLDDIKVLLDGPRLDQLWNSFVEICQDFDEISRGNLPLKPLEPHDFLPFSEPEAAASEAPPPPRGDVISPWEANADDSVFHDLGVSAEAPPVGEAILDYDGFKALSHGTLVVIEEKDRPAINGKFKKAIAGLVFFIVKNEKGEPDLKTLHYIEDIKSGKIVVKKVVKKSEGAAEPPEGGEAKEEKKEEPKKPWELRTKEVEKAISGARGELLKALLRRTELSGPLGGIPENIRGDKVLHGEEKVFLAQEADEKYNEAWGKYAKEQEKAIEKAQETAAEIIAGLARESERLHQAIAEIYREGWGKGAKKEPKGPFKKEKELMRKDLEFKERDFENKLGRFSKIWGWKIKVGKMQIPAGRIAIAGLLTGAGILVERFLGDVVWKPPYQPIADLMGGPPYQHEFSHYEFAPGLFASKVAYTGAIMAGTRAALDLAEWGIRKKLGGRRTLFQSKKEVEAQWEKSTKADTKKQMKNVETEITGLNQKIKDLTRVIKLRKLGIKQMKDEPRHSPISEKDRQKIIDEVIKKEREVAEYTHQIDLLEAQKKDLEREFDRGGIGQQIEKMQRQIASIEGYADINGVREGLDKEMQKLQAIRNEIQTINDDIQQIKRDHAAFHDKADEAIEDLRKDEKRVLAIKDEIQQIQHNKQLSDDEASVRIHAMEKEKEAIEAKIPENNKEIEKIQTDKKKYDDRVKEEIGVKEEQRAGFEAQIPGIGKYAALIDGRDKMMLELVESIIEKAKKEAEKKIDESGETARRLEELKVNLKELYAEHAKHTKKTNPEDRVGMEMQIEKSEKEKKKLEKAIDDAKKAREQLPGLEKEEVVDHRPVLIGERLKSVLPHLNDMGKQLEDSLIKKLAIAKSARVGKRLASVIAGFRLGPFSQFAAEWITAKNIALGYAVGKGLKIAGRFGLRKLGATGPYGGPPEKGHKGGGH